MTSAYRRAPQRVFWGRDALGHLAEELARERARRPMIICGASVRAHPRLLPRVIGAAGVPIAGIFSAVRSHTPLATVLAASAGMEHSGADGLIVVGGGSALVTARAATILHSERRPIEDLSTQVNAAGEVVSPRLLAPKLPIIAVPTTPTTAVCKAGTAVTAPGLPGRLAMFDPKTRSRSILLDHECLASSPAELVRNASLNALVMAVEGLATERSHIFSDALLVHAVRQFVHLLPDLIDQDATPQRRVDAALASILVGDGTDATGGGLTAALSHTIGHHHEVHNGIIDAILLPVVLDRTPPSAQARTRIAESVGCAPALLSTRLAALLARADVPRRLRDVGVPLDAVDRLAEEATNDFSYRQVARRLDTRVVAEILRAAW